MKLSKQDTDLFFTLMWSLQFFVHQRLHILPRVDTLQAYIERVAELFRESWSLSWLSIPSLPPSVFRFGLTRFRLPSLASCDYIPHQLVQIE